MSFEAYPSIIPIPIYDGNSMTQVDPVVRTKFDSGAMKARRRFSSTPTMWKVKFRFSDYEMRIFRSWYKHKIADGTDKFTVFISVPTGTQVFHVCQFTKMYKFMQTDFGWDVTAELLVANVDTDDEAWLDARL